MDDTSAPWPPGWADEHYEIVGRGEDAIVQCRQCGRHVTYLTKHASVRHGDPIAIAPVRNGRVDASLW